MASMSTNLDIDFLGRVTADSARAVSGPAPGMRCADAGDRDGATESSRLLPPDGEVEPWRVPASAMVIRATWPAGTALYRVTVRKSDHGLIRYAGCLPRRTAAASPGAALSTASSTSSSSTLLIPDRFLDGSIDAPQAMKAVTRSRNVTGIRRSAPAPSEGCGPATGQRDQHLRREQLPDTGDGDRPDLVVGQLQLQPVAFIAEICAGVVRTEGTAPAVEAPTLVGTERSHPGYECAIGED
jgi:hypothetical protein